MAQEFKPSDHQVGGHRFDEGRMGSLVDGNGLFLKPMQSGERGDKEAQFYEKLKEAQEKALVPVPAVPIFPQCFGTKTVHVPIAAGPASFLVLEDQCHGYVQPCILDIKMGRRTWYEGAPEKYITKCLEKDAETTSGSLGFRIAGMQVFDQSRGAMWKAPRNWCKSVSVTSMPHALRLFVSKSPFQHQEKQAEGQIESIESSGSVLASSVYHGPEGVVSQLAVFKQWFEAQKAFQFYSASILVTYEGDETSISENGRNVRIRMIDFAHVIDAEGKRDENFLEAIDAVTNMLQTI